MPTQQEMEMYAFFMSKMDMWLDLNEAQAIKFCEQFPLTQEGGTEGVPEEVLAGFAKFKLWVDALLVAREGLGEMEAFHAEMMKEMQPE
tara:strand:- start:161 stop:427 length:267 start_codon:yes stop_codon:yes gene_type:complete